MVMMAAGAAAAAEVSDGGPRALITPALTPAPSVAAAPSSSEPWWDDTPPDLADPTPVGAPTPPLSTATSVTSTPQRRSMPPRIRPVPNRVQAVVALLSANSPEVASVNLGGCDITTKGFDLLGQALKTNTTCEQLFVYNTFITHAGMLHLVDGLRGNRTVHNLNLGENTMPHDTVDLLIELLVANPAITQLYLDWGTTSADQKLQINRLLSTAAREHLWLALHGSVPPGALDQRGHHGGFRGANRRLPGQAVMAPGSKSRKHVAPPSEAALEKRAARKARASYLRCHKFGACKKKQTKRSDPILATPRQQAMWPEHRAQIQALAKRRGFNGCRDAHRAVTGFRLGPGYCVLVGDRVCLWPLPEFGHDLVTRLRILVLNRRLLESPSGALPMHTLKDDLFYEDTTQVWAMGVCVRGVKPLVDQRCIGLRYYNTCFTCHTSLDSGADALEHVDRHIIEAVRAHGDEHSVQLCSPAPGSEAACTAREHLRRALDRRLPPAEPKPYTKLTRNIKGSTVRMYIDHAARPGMSAEQPATSAEAQPPEAASLPESPPARAPRQPEPVAAPAPRKKKKKTPAGKGRAARPTARPPTQALRKDAAGRVCKPAKSPKRGVVKQASRAKATAKTEKKPRGKKAAARPAPSRGGSTSDQPKRRKKKALGASKAPTPRKRKRTTTTTRASAEPATTTTPACPICAFTAKTLSRLRSHISLAHAEL